MESNRSKTTETPFPGNGSIPLKLREIFHSAGIEPTNGRRIDWEDLPYALYDKGLYLSGLPARLFFTKDNPSAEEQVSRLNVLLKWPFPGIDNPLKLIERACASGHLVMLRRPQDRDVVFEVTREDGSKMDIGQWKAPRPPTSHPKLPAISSFSPVATSNNFTQTASSSLRLATGGVYSGNEVMGKPMSPASPATSTPKSRVTPTIAKPGNRPPVSQKASSIPDLLSTSKGSKLRVDPYPESKNIPLKLREIFKQADIPESKSYPGHVDWKAFPESLWLSGRYITGIRSVVILGTMDPTIRQIREAKEKPLKFSLPKTELEKMEKALERGRIRLLPRPKERDVVLEVTTDDGTLDIGRWDISTAKTLDIPEPPSLPQLKSTPARRKAIIDDSDSSDEEEILTPETPQPKRSVVNIVASPAQPGPFPRSREVSLGFRRLFEKAGVEEDPEKPGLIPWADIPHFLWRNGWYIAGLPEKLVLGNKSLGNVVEEPWDPSSHWHDHETPQLLESLRRGKVKLVPRPADRNVVFEVLGEKGRSTDIGQWRERQPSSPAESNVPSDTEMDTGGIPENADEEHNKPPLVQWKDEVNNVVDQLSEMLVNSGVKLPQNPSRANAYKIPWSDLPGLLNDAQVTLAGFPLKLLPYWKAQNKLNGKWVVTWKRTTLDHMVDLLDNDGIGVEKWTAGSNAVVQALDEENSDEYTFTYDDFVNAKNDDPEHVAINGQILGLADPNHSGKRKRLLSSVAHEDRAPKRQKTLDGVRPLPVASILQAGIENRTDSGYDTAADSRQSTSKEDQPERALDSDYYAKLPHDPELTVIELNSKYRRQKEVIKNVIAILSEPYFVDSTINPDLVVYHDIPCIAPEDESLDFFLPWSNLPRHLAARMVYLAGWPSLCAPIVQDDQVVTGFGPAFWDDGQWNLMENALLNDAIDVKKASRELLPGPLRTRPHLTVDKHLFQLVDANGEKQMSTVNFSKLWLDTNWGFEADQSVTIFAKDVSIMDPIVVETDDEGEDDEEMEVD